MNAKEWVRNNLPNLTPTRSVSDGGRQEPSLTLRVGASMVLVVLSALAGHLLAGPETVDERAQQLQHDDEMIRALVKGGLNLAKEPDPLKRADQCNEIADVLGRGVKKAVGKKDGTRAALLGEQMQSILVQGVAVNLTTARETMKPDHEAIAKVGQNVADSARSIEEEVQRLAEPEIMLLTLQAIAKGKTEVDLAVKGQGKPKGPPHKKGKT
jgi:hypothetical protein